MIAPRWRRHLAAAGVLGFFLMLNTATSSPRRTPLPPWDAGAGAVDAAIVDAGPDSIGAMLEPDDGTIRAMIGCVAAKKEGCRIFDDFVSGTLPKTATLPKERAVWFGKAYGVGGKGDGKTVFAFLAAENTGRKGAYEQLEEVDGPDAEALFGRVSKGSAAGASVAFGFMKGATPSDGFHPLMPAAVSLRIRAAVPAWVRQKGDRWIVLEYTGSPIAKHGGVEALAWLAELWLAK